MLDEPVCWDSICYGYGARMPSSHHYHDLSPDICSAAASCSHSLTEVTSVVHCNLPKVSVSLQKAMQLFLYRRQQCEAHRATALQLWLHILKMINERQNWWQSCYYFVTFSECSCFQEWIQKRKLHLTLSRVTIHGLKTLSASDPVTVNRDRSTALHPEPG